MLAITRRIGEETIITTLEGRVIRETVLRVSPGRVTLGYTADREVRIDRREVHEAIHGKSTDLEGDGCGPLTAEDRQHLEAKSARFECVACRELFAEPTTLVEDLCPTCLELRPKF